MNVSSDHSPQTIISEHPIFCAMLAASASHAHAERSPATLRPPPPFTPPPPVSTPPLQARAARRATWVTWAPRGSRARRRHG